MPKILQRGTKSGRKLKRISEKSTWEPNEELGDVKCDSDDCGYYDHYDDGNEYHENKNESLKKERIFWGVNRISSTASVSRMGRNRWKKRILNQSL